MNKTALMPLVAGLVLAAIPSHAQSANLVFNSTTISSVLNTTLSAFDGGADDFVNILATDNGAAVGQTYAAGQLGFDGAEFEILNLTQPQNAVSFPGTYNVTPQLAFNDLTLTELFSNGTTQTLNLFDLSDPTTPTNSSDPFGLASDGVTPLTGDLLSDPVTLPTSGPSLVSATLTGQFSDDFTPAGQPIPVQIAAVPEPGTAALLLAGLAPLAALGLRARRAARRS